MLNDDDMAACGLTRKVLCSLSGVSRDSTKQTKMIAQQENNFWKDCEKCYPSIKLLKDTFKELKHQTQFF